MADRSDEIRRRLAAIVSSSDDAIVSKDLNGTVLSWNDAAERMFGYTAEQMIGRSIRVLIPADRQSEEDAVLESIRAGRRVDHFETVRQSRDGHMIPISLTVSPILDADGKVVGASKIARDISDRKQAEVLAARSAHRESFLAEVTLTLTRSLDYEQTLRTLAAAATPAIADYCAVDVVDEDGTLRPVAIEHVNPDKIPLAQEVRANYEDPQMPTSPRSVARTGVPIFVPQVSDDMLVAAAQGNAERLNKIRALGLVLVHVCADGRQRSGVRGPDAGQYGIIASARQRRSAARAGCGLARRARHRQCAVLSAAPERQPAEG